MYISVNSSFLLLLFRNTFKKFSKETRQSIVDAVSQNLDPKIEAGGQLVDFRTDRQDPKILFNLVGRHNPWKPIHKDLSYG